MAFDIEAAKADGYTDAEIQAYLNDQAGKTPPLPTPEKNKHHEANVGTAQFGAVAGAEQVGEVGKKLLEYGLPAAGIGYGVYKGAQSFANRAPGPVPPTSTPTPTTATSGFDAGGQKVADFVNQRGQFAPETPTPSAQAQAYQKTAQEAAARQAAAQPPTAANFMQRIAQLATKYAPLARITTGAGLMTYSPNLGPQVPSAGPARGMEINPQTGRPWTEFELARYNQQY